MITQELPAAGQIEIGTAVYIDASGRLNVCAANDDKLAGLCVGIAMTSSTAAGTPVTYVISGVTRAASAEDLIPGKPVYIAPDGTLKSLVSEADVETFYGSAMFLQRVGTAVSENMVQVSIEPAVLKGE